MKKTPVSRDLAGALTVFGFSLVISSCSLFSGVLVYRLLPSSLPTAARNWISLLTGVSLLTASQVLLLPEVEGKPTPPALLWQALLDKLVPTPAPDEEEPTDEGHRTL